MVNTKTVTASLIACVALSTGCVTDTLSEQSGVININSEAKALESEIIAFYTGDDAPIEGGAEASGEGEWTEAEGQDPRQFCEEESRRRQGEGEHEDEDGEVDEGPDGDDGEEDDDGEVDEGPDGDDEDDDGEVDEGPDGDDGEEDDDGEADDDSEEADDDEADDDEPVMMSVEPNMSVDEVEPDAELTQECLERNRESVRHRVRGCLEACAEQLSEDVEDVRAELLACYEMTCEELPHPEHSERDGAGGDHEGDEHEGDHEGDEQEDDE